MYSSSAHPPLPPDPSSTANEVPILSTGSLEAFQIQNKGRNRGGAVHVDLRSRCRYFYSLGCSTTVTKPLHVCSSEVYEAGQSSRAACKRWRMGRPRFEVAPVLGRKRKPT